MNRSKAIGDSAAVAAVHAFEFATGGFEFGNNCMKVGVINSRGWVSDAESKQELKDFDRALNRDIHAREQLANRAAFEAAAK